MARGYLGKISAVVAINTGGVKPSLNSSAKDIQSWGRTVQSRLSSTSEAAKRAVDGIFTPLQKLQAAVNAANRNPLKLDVPNVRAYLDLARAIDQIGKPLGNAQKQFSSLSQGVQSELLPAFRGAQKQATQLFDAISSGAKVSDRDLANTEARIGRVVQAIARANEASQAVRGLAGGQELRFQNPEFLRSTSRAAQLQQQAAALAPDAIAGRGIVALVGQQRQAADEAERLRAILERTIVTRNGDQEAAQRAYTQQIAFLDQVNDRLERQIQLERQASEVNANVGAATQLRSTQDPTGRSIQQRLRDIRDAEISSNVGAFSRRATDVRQYIALLEEARRRTESLADAQRRAEAASRFLQVDQQGSDIASNEGRSVPLAGNRDPRTRVLNTLNQDIGDLRNRTRGIGDTLSGDVGPIVDNLTTRFQNLARAGVGFTAEQARRLAQEVAGVNAALNARQAAAQRFGESFGGAGRLGLSLGVDERSLRAIGGQIEFVQGRLAGLAQEARGPVIAALDSLRTRAQQLFEGGALDTVEGRRELQLLREELIRTLSAAGGGSERRIADQLRRVGDVARGSFGNAGLAVQQAAFAIEDFFSVTGGLDQRIRAAGNNISQLGFILGGTTGLIVGISAAIGAQLVAALIKWYNEGRTAEDQTKALNDALARQKSIVEDLRKAFESLGDSIARRAFSGPAQEAREFARQLQEVADKQRQLREARVADLDAGVQRERANQNRISRELQTETDAGRRVVLQRDLNDSIRREREAASAASGRRISGEDVAAAIERALIRAASGGLDNFTPDAAVSRDARAARRAVPTGQSPDDIFAQRRAIEDQISSLRGREAQGNLGARAAIAELQAVLNALELPLQEAIDELSNQILRSSFSAAIEIEAAQSDVADAIRRGVPGAAIFQQNLDNLASQMEAAQARLRDAQQSDSPDREAQVRQAERDINGIRVRQEAIAERAREVRLTSGRGGERTASALSALQGNERFANEYGRLTARLRDAVDAEAASRRELDKAIASGSDADKEAARAAYEAAAANSDLAAAAAEAALAMEQAVARIRKIGADAVAQSERMADEAQQRFNDRPTDANRQRRDDAERQLIADRERVARANNALDRRRSELQESDPRLMQINAELEAINQERRRLSDEAAQNGTTVSADDAQRLADREARLLAEREQRLFSLTEAQRRQQDAINQEIAARRRLVDFMDEVDRRRNPQGDPVRGLDLLDSPGQRAARELRQANADIASAVEQSIALAIREGRFGDIPGIQQRGREAQDRAREDSLRQTAPAIFGLADAVQNALLQGPSRAALNPTDVSTVEGSRELTRLLRGDDAARDQANLVELQKQANELLRRIAEDPAPVAN